MKSNVEQLSFVGSAKPFIKWAGGKSQILNEIRAKYPAGLGKSIIKYAEPFVGGGAVLFDVLNNYSLSEVYVSDINRELIHVYACIRDRLYDLVYILEKMEYEYLQANEQTRDHIYYETRKRFNVLKAIKSEETELAALFIFLNRTCFNGLYRVNGSGEFNVPAGSYKTPKICDRYNLEEVSLSLKKVNIVCADYKKSCAFIDAQTFVYFDPPYRPLSRTSNFNSYSQDGFDDDSQIELAHFINEMNEKGAHIILSNSDPKNSDDTDDFFDKLYLRHNISRIEAMRMINSIASGRGKISELLITNY